MTVKTQSLAQKYESYQETSFVFHPFQPRPWLPLILLVILVIIVSLWVSQIIPIFVFGMFLAALSYLGIIRSRHKLHTTAAICFLVIFYVIITGNEPLARPRYADFRKCTAIVMITILPFILFSVAPAKAISRRLIFLALGLLLLIALNELSKLGLDVTAPKLQG